ncbi:Acetyltransferase YpeA [Sporomusa carbonis]|uniref:GNAT family N-acetyltransferase n=1 Tax=Sporomusa carbonis TaxID=3076075 RepID=UPI003A6D9FA2
MDKKIVIRAMDSNDYEKVMNLWSTTEGIGLSDADTKANIEMFLNRNSGLSCVAELGEHIVGAVLCGHDGRRGYFHHLAVNTVYRGRGIARQLIGYCLSRLKEQGISKCHLFVFTNHQRGIAFWSHMGFYKRTDLNVFSKDI